MHDRTGTPLDDRSGTAFLNGHSRRPETLLSLVRWCIAHRRLVVVTWVAVAVLATVVAQSVGRDYATNFTPARHRVPARERPAHARVRRLRAATSTRSSSTSRTAASTRPRCVRRSRRCWHARTRSRTSWGSSAPTRPRGAVQVSPDRMTAFATINYDKRANLLPNNTGKPVLDAVKAIHVPGLQVAAGGPVIEQAEGFSIGPATTVGVIAALVILLITFGSLIAAGMPLITAGLGPDHRSRADRTRDTRHEHVERRPRAGADDRPRRRHRLRALHRHALSRELRGARRRASER